MRTQQVDKGRIKEYWETRAPQRWYSYKEEGSLEWFNEIAHKRYSIYYPYIKEAAEFESHYGEKVLEIGVGVGTDLLQYAKNGSRVHGVDLTENAIAVTKKNFDLHNQKYEILETGDAENLKFKDNSFDLIFSFGTIHHTPNMQKAIGEVHRVLKPEGKAVIMLYARGWKHYFKRVFVHGLCKGEAFKYGLKECINKNTEVQGNSPLTYVLKKRDIAKLFDKFGELEIKKYRLGEFFEYAPRCNKQFPEIIRDIFKASKLERLLGENYIIKAVKCPKREAKATLLQDLLDHA